MNTLPLTPLQDDLWRFICSCELSPSLEEMKAKLGLSNKSQVARLLDALEQRGFIRRTRYIARSVIGIDPTIPNIANVKTSALLAELEHRGILLGCAR